MTRRQYRVSVAWHRDSRLRASACFFLVFRFLILSAAGIRAGDHGQSPPDLPYVALVDSSSSSQLRAMSEILFTQATRSYIRSTRVKIQTDGTWLTIDLVIANRTDARVPNTILLQVQFPTLPFFRLLMLVLSAEFLSSCTHFFARFWLCSFYKQTPPNTPTTLVFPIGSPRRTQCTRERACAIRSLPLAGPPHRNPPPKASHSPPIPLCLTPF